MAKGFRVAAFAAAAGLLVLAVPEAVSGGLSTHLAIGDELQGGALLGPLALAFLGGVLTSLTPCLYPLIPITVGVFGARGAATRTRAVLLSSAYVLGMAAMFTSLGIAAALTGMAFGSALGNPWVVAGLALVLAVLASSMFGAFDLALPTGLASRLARVGGAGVAGAFLMGIVAGVVAAPCTGPVLSGILVHVAKTQDVGLGAMLLFAYALGVGLLFFLLGVFSFRLPRAGPWMDAVKSLFGIALIALAISYLRDGFPLLRGVLDPSALPYGAWLLAGFVALGVALGALDRRFSPLLPEGLIKGAAVLLVVAGLTMRPTALMGKPLPASSWVTSEGDARAQALAQRRPVLIDFFADWCAACKDLERLVYTTPAFQREAERFLLVKVDGTNEPPDVEALYRKYGVKGLPTVVLIDSSGRVRGDLTITGFIPAADFAAQMRRVE